MSSIAQAQCRARRHVAQVSTSLLALGAILIVGAPDRASASSACDVEKRIERAPKSTYRIAAWLDATWRIYDYVDGTTTATLPAWPQEVCLAWEAPPHMGFGPGQIVYVSTQYDPRQAEAIRLNRNHPVPTGKSIGPNRDEFRELREAMPVQPLSPEKQAIVSWLDTSVWVVNRSGYDVVASALGLLDDLPMGTERLLRIGGPFGKRPKASWIRFTTKGPRQGHKLFVSVAYSGDAEAAVYRYEFAPKAR